LVDALGDVGHLSRSRPPCEREGGAEAELPPAEPLRTRSVRRQRLRSNAVVASWGRSGRVPLYPWRLMRTYLARSDFFASRCFTDDDWRRYHPVRRVEGVQFPAIGPPHERHAARRNTSCRGSCVRASENARRGVSRTAYHSSRYSGRYGCRRGEETTLNWSSDLVDERVSATLV
jgi:hypothetical protein